MSVGDAPFEPERLRFVAEAGTDGTIHRFVMRVAFHCFRTDPLQRVGVAAEVWGAVARETAFGTAPGSRVREDIELQVPGGFVPITAEPSIEGEHAGVALLASGAKASMDFQVVM